MGNISIQSIAIWGAVIFLGALVVFLLAAMFPIKTERLVLWGINHFVPKKWREKIAGIMLRFLTGLESLRTPKDVLFIFLTSIVVWLLETGKYWFLMHAFPFSVKFFCINAHEWDREFSNYYSFRSGLHRDI